MITSISKALPYITLLAYRFNGFVVRLLFQIKPRHSNLMFFVALTFIIYRD